MASHATDYVTGDGRILNIRDIADTYRNIVNQSHPESGKIQRISDNHYSLTCHFSTTDCDQLEAIKTSKTYGLITETVNSDRHIKSVLCMTEDRTLAEVNIATSENGRFLAKLRGTEKQILEIWDRRKLLKTIDTTELEVHGQINTDNHFSSFYWCPFGEQDKLLYVCNKKRLKYQSFFKQKTPTGNVTDSDASDSAKGKALNLGNDSVRQEDWGERLKGIEHTIVAVLDVSADCKITLVDIDGFSIGDARWVGNSGLKTISVAYSEEPRRLGLQFSNNRPSKLVIHDWSQSPPVEVQTLENDTHCYHTPRVSYCGNKLVYLSCPIYGPHMRPVRLNLYNLDTKEDRVLTDKSTGQVDFFIGTLPHNCFSANDNHIIFVESDHLFKHVCLYSFEKSRKTRIKFPTTGLDLLDYRYDIILAKGSEVNATPTLFVAALSPLDPAELVAWHQIEDCTHLDEIEYETYEIPTPDRTAIVSAILTTPNVTTLQANFSTGSEKLDKSKLAKDSSELPTVVLVHGGPHSAFMTEYMPFIVFYTRLGLRSLFINYRGSIGVSEEYLTSLCGKVGSQDVYDCLHVIRHFAKAELINSQKLVIQGGSHGGFLACHLSCQEEFKFTSAIIANPVVDISSMHTTSDMPDWAYTEALGHSSYDFTWMPSAQELAKMYEMSPISRYREAKVPTLMLLGNKDYRVKMFQGERWIELLKARGLKTLCKVYDDNHSLAKVGVLADRNMTAAIWILENLRSV